jgi:hypothetical protein
MKTLTPPGTQPGGKPVQAIAGLRDFLDAGRTHKQAVRTTGGFRGWIRACMRRGFCRSGERTRIRSLRVRVRNRGAMSAQVEKYCRLKVFTSACPQKIINIVVDNMGEEFR